MPTGFILGIDGGATKSAAVLCDLTGRMLARQRAGACTIEPRLSPASRSVLQRLVEDLCAQAGVAREALAYYGIGMNGVDFEDEHAAQLGQVAEALGVPASKIGLVNDGIAALWGTTSAPAAVILQHGTGVTTAWRRRPGGETLFDSLDVGKLFDMRREALAIVARMIDGRLPSTDFKQMIMAQLGIADEERFAEALYRGIITGDRLRSTAPVIYRAWQDGDETAGRLVSSAADDYVLTACTMAARTESLSPHTAFGGGVIRLAPSAFMELLRTRVLARLPQAVVTSPQLAPEHGAAVMAAFRLGVPPEGFFERLLEQVRKGTP